MWNHKPVKSQCYWSCPLTWKLTRQTDKTIRIWVVSRPHLNIRLTKNDSSKHSSLFWSAVCDKHWHLDNPHHRRIGVAAFIDGLLQLPLELGAFLGHLDEVRASLVDLPLENLFFLSSMTQCTIYILRSSYDEDHEWRLYYKWVTGFASPLASAIN